MNRNKNNPNWQDKLLGGAILTGFVVVAVIAGLLALVTRNHDGRIADHLPELTSPSGGAALLD
jgi:hypothetical protein